MKRTVRFFALLLVAAMLLAAVPMRASAAETVTFAVEGGNLYFDKTSGTITDCDTSATAAVIPDEIEGVAVTQIGDKAFQYCNKLTGVTIGSRVLRIGEEAFYACYGLKEIVIPDNVTDIEKKAFNACNHLLSVQIGKGVQSIGELAFQGCVALTGIWVDEANTAFSSDSYGVLFDKQKTTLICCPQTYQGAYAIADGVTSISKYAFENCTGLTDVTIPGSVRTIEEYAFHRCDALTAVTIPQGVTSIGDFAFSFSLNLSQVHIGASVKSIGRSVFSGDNMLAAIWVDPANQFYCSDENGILFDKEKTILIKCPPLFSGAYVIPETVETVEDYAFSDCAALTAVTFTSGLKEIKGNAFDGCIGLTSVVIPDNVTEIGAYAFGDCSELLTVTIGNGVTRIGSHAFDACSKLTSVTLGKNVNAIGSFAFCIYGDLLGIWVDEENQRYSSDANGVLFNKEKTALYQCPGGYSGSYTIPNTVKTIGENAFRYCRKLTSITIPTSVISITAYAFDECTSLTDVYYQGTQEEWKKISIIYGNDELKNATIHFADEVTFSDVKESDYFAKPVSWAVANSITNGVSATEFAPEAACTRGQIMTFLWRAKGCVEPTSNENPFTDLNTNSYYYKAVLWAVENGITSGVSATEFAPEATCTRAQAATFLYRCFGSPEANTQANPFTDISVTDYYYKAVLWAVENGITNGVSATEFAPNQNCTRGQIVTFLYRAFT